jgi:O-antigen/teichoic acid export membrane protein
MEKNLSFYTFYYVMSLVLMRGSGIIAKILLARSITPYEYGLITLFVIALPGMFQNVTIFCFYDILGHGTEGKKYLGFSLKYGVLATALLAIIFFTFHEAIFTFLNIPLDYWWILSIILFVALFSITICVVIMGYLRGSRNYSMVTTISAAPSILRVIFIFFALYLFGVDNFWLIIILFTLPLLFVLIPVVAFKFRTICLSLKTISLPPREMFIFGLSFFMLSSWVGLSQQITSILISHKLGVVWQGYFDVSLSLVAVLTFFSSSIYLISAPETTVNDNLSDILHRKGGLGDVGRIFFSLTLLCVIIIFFYSHQLISLVFTSNYALSADYLYILAIGYAVLFVQQYLSFLNISSDKDGISRLTLVTVACILLFPIFTYIMISYFQFLGAYLASTIFILVYTLVTIILLKNRTPLFLLLKKFDRLIISVSGTVLIVYLSHFSLIPGIITAMVVFSVLTIASGYLDKDMLMDLLCIKGKNT